jgi:predicted MFS family arabinose efflux permease
MGFAAAAWMAAIGAALTGFGYSLVFPALGVEAVRRAPPESRGVAMGAYTACLDLALGVSGPVLGAVASHAGLSAVFLVSAAVVLCAAGIALRLLSQQTAAVRHTSRGFGVMPQPRGCGRLQNS